SSSRRARQPAGLPRRSAYLDQASTLLRDQMLPTLDEVVLDDADRVAADFAGVRDACGSWPPAWSPSRCSC
ncbi:hypothetical protein, partial [Cellulosimicrobium sp. CUA-896]|uniref:hypothetical protein n=1 Tax=Cellulosimicrobium sp. CUA-896 TaxID=1517881 RepID=UPI000A7286E6